MRRSKKVWKLRVTGLCEGNWPVTGEFATQRACDAKNINIDEVIGNSWDLAFKTMSVTDSMEGIP